MPIKYVKGDLLESDCDVIAHGCNCFNTMGAGIARQIRAKYPGVYTADLTTKSGNKRKLGTMTMGYTKEPEPLVFNLYTQYRPGRNLDIEALNKCFENLSSWLDETDPDRELKVGIPMIGCGIAGGDWGEVCHVIQKHFPNRTIWVYRL